MNDDFVGLVAELVGKAPIQWMDTATATLKKLPSTTSLEVASASMPATNNADLANLTREVLRVGTARMSWEALAWTLETTSKVHQRWRRDREIEFLWAGPSPPNQIPARRIDQVLYDLIAAAKHEIILVTFAAAKIERLARELLIASNRGVYVRLILEFEEASEGQLSFDAIKAFLPDMLEATEVYYWPVERRDRNAAGRPGKLHAKMAVIDGIALVSSANLTDDAFNRNLEIGAMIREPEFLLAAESHIASLIATGVLQRVTK